jgi:deazaflavin-dependent oxidoreductase (nitroreductase family)
MWRLARWRASSGRRKQAARWKRVAYRRSALATPLAAIVEAESRPRRFGALVGRLVELPVIGRSLARAARAPLQLGPGPRLITRFHAWLLRLSRGRLRRSWLLAGGQPVLSLTTTGRRSGRARSTAVACFTHGNDIVVAGMALGMTRDPAWALNLEANPDATIALGGQTIAVRARRAAGEEAAQLWRRWVRLQPSAEAFRDLAGREIPLFVLTRS